MIKSEVNIVGETIFDKIEMKMITISTDKRYFGILNIVESGVFSDYLLKFQGDFSPGLKDAGSALFIDSCYFEVNEIHFSNFKSSFQNLWLAVASTIEVDKFVMNNVVFDQKSDRDPFLIIQDSYVTMEQVQI